MTGQRLEPEIQKLAKLLKALPNNRRGTAEEIDLLNQLAWEIGLTQTKRAKELCEKALQLSEKIEYDQGQAYGLRNIAYCQFIASELENALENIRTALDKFKELEDRSGEASALDIMALVYWRLGCYDIAFQYAFDGLNLHRQNKFSKGEAWALYNIGLIYSEVGDDTQTIANYNAAKRIFKKISYPVGQGRVLSGLGDFYQRQGQLEKALECHLASLKISEEYGIQIGVSSALTEIGLIYQKVKKFDQAMEFYKKSLDMFEMFENKEIKAGTLAYMGSLYAETGNADRAVNFLNEAMRLANEVKSKPIAFRIHKELSTLHENGGSFREALYHHQQYGKLKDSVFSDESKTKLRYLQIRDSVDKTEKEAEIYRLKNVELGTMLNQISSAENKLVQSEKMAILGNLIAGLANEVKEPIRHLARSSDNIKRGIGVITETLESGEAQSASKQSLKDSIRILESDSLNLKSGSDRIIAILASLTDFAGTEQTPMEDVDIHSLLDSVLDLVLSHKQGDIKVVKDYGEISVVKGRYNELCQAFMTLLVNACEAISDQGTIRIQTQSPKSGFFIKISDSGKGIPAEKLDKIFDIGLSRKASRIGMHIGLASTYNIIQRHKGEISVRSEVNKGTEYTIKLSSE